MKAFTNILANRDGAVTLAIDATAGCVAIEGAAGVRHATELPGCGSDTADGASALSAALQEWTGAAHAERMRCRIALGSAFFRIDTATLPAMSESELASSARFEALDRFGLEDSQAVVQHVVLGETGGRRNVALVAARLDVVRRIAEIAMGAGLLPESIEHSALTAARGAMRWESAMSGERVAALHVEPTLATLSLWRSGRLAALRTISGDWSTASDESIVDALDTIPLEPVASGGWRWSSLAEETLRSLRQACGDAAWPSALAVSGAAAAQAELVRAVGGVCGTPTFPVDCGAWGGRRACRLGPSWASMLGAGVASEQAIDERRAA